MKESIINPGDTATLTIADVVYRGKGLARVEGQVVFVPGVLPGETVEVRFVRRHKNYAEAALLDVIQASPMRIAPVCPLAAVCPGCRYQHVAYEEEIRLKQAQLVNLLERQAETPAAVCLPPVASPKPLEYRNKISLHASCDGSSTTLGYVGEDNRTVIDVPACPLAVPPINELLSQLRSDPGFLATLRTQRSLTLRHTWHDGAIHFQGTGGTGKPWLTETTILGKVHVPRCSFFQVNHGVADPLLQAVLGILKGTSCRSVVDLYGGVGVFALAARSAGLSRVIGIDSDETAIQAARQNATDLDLKNVEFEAQPAAKGLKLAFRHVDPAGALLIVDPPRIGLDKTVIDLISKNRPPEIVYVSCAADTMARDVRALAPAGYHVARCQLFDMFPRTPYFESLTLLKRG